MKNAIIHFSKLFRPWFAVDSRSLGIFRILLGFLCLSDILRRWTYIDIFYSDSSIISPTTSSSFYKMFNLLSTFTKSWEVHLFFLIGIIFSIFLIIGYKSKLSHIISAIVIISIHNRAIILENAGDMFFNSVLIWTLFLPLGISYSIDSLKNSLATFKENNIDDLNNRDFGLNKPKKIYSLAFFAMLYQISAIYFFTAFNKSGYDWKEGIAVYKMYQLDTFLTPIGFFLRDFITEPVSKFLTYSTIYLEYSIPILLFIPIYHYIFRTFAVLALTCFHLMIQISIKVGLFSFTMIVTYALLIDTKVYYYLNRIIKKYIIKNKKYILFYDSDCGFCHYTIRIIKRLDIYNRITFADKNYNDEKPKNFDSLNKETAILFNPENKSIWIKHQAFGKLLCILPLGFMIGWIFFIPLVTNFFEIVYTFVAKNRTKISQYFGQQACDISSSQYASDINEEKHTPFQNSTNIIMKVCSSVIVLTLIFATFNYNLVANEAINKYMEKNGYEKFTYNKNLKRICYYPRMIQRWNMFSPTVLGTDKTVIIDAELYNGENINPFTGKEPVINSLEYENLWHGHTQFWRKFFSRVSKKNNKKYIDSFERWIKKRSNNYFEDTIGDQKIKSIKIWSIRQRNAKINKEQNNKVSKKLLNVSKNNSSSGLKKKQPVK